MKQFLYIITMKNNKAMNNLRTPYSLPVVDSIGSGLSFGPFTIPNSKIKRSRPLLPRMQKRQSSLHSMTSIDNFCKAATSREIKKAVTHLS